MPANSGDRVVNGVGRPPPVPSTTSHADTAELAAALVRMGLALQPEEARFTSLTGGVSSDIFKVEAGERTFCMKSALPKLKVAADWHAPLERNRFELDYISVAAQIVPAAFPALLGADAQTGCFAMEFLPPERFPVWKTQLRNGLIDEETAWRVGDVLGRVHAATADNAALATHFATDASFDALRLDAYLATAARASPEYADAIDALAEATRQNKRVLVHGDYSPKNILVGPECPVILDAECAWFGDPAFDAAFLLNHLVLKGAWKPQWRPRYLGCFGAFVRGYFDRVSWEDRAALEARTARLLPGLMLARIDGKSPVEYLTDDASRQAVRNFATRFLRDRADRLYEISTAWQNFAEIR